MMDRRDFLRQSAAVAAFSIVPAVAARTYAANAKIALGLTGCGGRGRWIGRLFEEFSDFKVVSIHDYFRNRLHQTSRDLSIPEERCHAGLDGYLAMLNDGVDAVAVESPPYFHPEHAAAALAAGKHAYIAKPMGVDAAGCLRIVEAAEKAPGLCALVDFQTRNNEFYREAVKKVRDGAIGDAVMGQCFYHCGRLGTQAKPGTETARLRNWVFDKALSGDIIVEQNIHVIDVANWLIGGHPLRATGTGGRKARVDVGDCWDHFIVAFEYPNDVLVDFSSVQFQQGSNDDLFMKLYGTLGTVETHYGGTVSIGGKVENWPGGSTATIYQDGAVNNIRDFHAAITSGTPINNTREAADSNLAAILGRMAAYEKRTVTWEEMLADNTPLDARLNLPENGPDTKD
ncbi:MAG: Gfo/Idh/MocA family oxidoreductase [Candidatus Hydrogenedentes bacterium]|nr:Gfo/Idh/MocA family oxidoreductase [Candidatus Hydrogenedentota bacterium]